jgi:hypothetical protein
VWCRDKALKTTFPNLFSLARCKDASVVDHSEVSRNSHQQNVNFLRAAHDWEVDSFTSFFNLLYSFNLRRGGEDKLCWVPSRIGLFDVKSYCNILVPHVSIIFPWEYLAE